MSSKKSEMMRGGETAFLSSSSLYYRSTDGLSNNSMNRMTTSSSIFHGAHNLILRSKKLVSQFFSIDTPLLEKAWIAIIFHTTRYTSKPSPLRRNFNASFSFFFSPKIRSKASKGNEKMFAHLGMWWVWQITTFSHFVQRAKLWRSLLKKASNYVEAHNIIWITAKGVINLKIDNCVPSIVLVVKDSTEATSFWFIGSWSVGIFRRKNDIGSQWQETSFGDLLYLLFLNLFRHFSSDFC